MLKLERILAPVDFSESSRTALVSARDLAVKFNAELHVLHVVAPGLVEYMAESGSAYRLSYEQFEKRIGKAAETAMEELLQTTGCDNATSQVVSGFPGPEIRDYAEKHEIDMIVMGTHGRTGLAHLLIGSVAENVVRTATCPVLTVRDCQVSAGTLSPEAVGAA